MTYWIYDPHRLTLDSDIHPKATLSRLYFENTFCLEQITSPAGRSAYGVRISLSDTGMHTILTSPLPLLIPTRFEVTPIPTTTFSSTPSSTLQRLMSFLTLSLSPRRLHPHLNTSAYSSHGSFPARPPLPLSRARTPTTRHPAYPPYLPPPQRSASATPHP